MKTKKRRLKPARSENGSLTREEILAETNGLRTLIRFCKEISDGYRPSDESLFQIAGAFEKILRGTKPERALELSKPKGRPALTGNEADQQSQFVFEIMMRRKAGLKLKDAIEDVANKYHRSEDALKAWYRRDRRLIEYLLKILPGIQTHNEFIQACDREARRILPTGKG